MQGVEEDHQADLHIAVVILTAVVVHHIIVTGALTVTLTVTTIMGITTTTIPISSNTLTAWLALNLNTMSLSIQAFTHLAL